MKILEQGSLKTICGLWDLRDDESCLVARGEEPRVQDKLAIFLGKMLLQRVSEVSRLFFRSLSSVQPLIDHPRAMTSSRMKAPRAVEEGGQPCGAGGAQERASRARFQASMRSRRSEA
jgi:hypothetical protein